MKYKIFEFYQSCRTKNYFFKLFNKKKFKFTKLMLTKYVQPHESYRGGKKQNYIISI